ncbi:type VII secretion-associated protein [Mycolicibacterium vaccae]|uniref:type VII secretion-associated protein n=1 Tax=Mycolicibacterium vaccae TaxID=1810 RepID=UPI003CF4B3DD
MTVLVEVGPRTVRGPRNPPAEWVAVAIDGIDDDLALLGDRPVAVADLWCDVLAVAAGDHPGGVAVVVPTWWPASRIATVRAATDGEVYTRAELLTEESDAVVVEVADELVLLVSATTDQVVLDRRAMELTSHLGGARDVLIDVPAAVPPLSGDELAELRASGIRVTHAGRQRLSHALPAPEQVRAGPRGRRTAATVGVLAAVGAGWALQAAASPSGDGAEWLVEGRVGLQVPAGWTVERVTTGPGSARVQVSDPAGGAAVHLTQSRLTAATSLPELAASLRTAIDDENPAVFVDFDPEGRVGERPAVTYREVRTHSHTRWAVWADGTTSIAVGCQTAPDDVAVLQQICARAVESARVVD